MKIKKGFVLRQVCGYEVIIGEGLDAINFGKILSLNESAAWIWNKAQEMGSFTVDALAEKLCEEYKVEMPEAQQDISNILQEWQQLGVIE